MAIRLAQTGLSEEERQMVRKKLAAGSINPICWNYLNDLHLTLSLRNLIQQEGKIIISFYLLTI